MSELTLVHQQVNSLASRLDLPGIDPRQMTEVLKATAFRGQVSDAHMSALLIVAQQYRLNPWTKEIWAYPDRNNGIVPIVSVDGWARIANEHPEFDGMEFSLEGTGEKMAMSCSIYRKDRSRPTVVTEYLEECKRNTEPWSKMPRRMLRNRAMVQAIRLAFGYGGIHELDEAETFAQPPATELTEGGGERPLMPAARTTPRPAPAPRAAAPTQGPMPQPRSQEPVEEARVIPPQEAEHATGAPRAAVAVEDDTGELATDGHKRNLELKVTAAGRSMPEFLDSLGFKIETLTVAQFNAAKKAL